MSIYASFLVFSRRTTQFNKINGFIRNSNSTLLPMTCMNPLNNSLLYMISSPRHTNIVNHVLKPAQIHHKTIQPHYQFTCPPQGKLVHPLTADTPASSQYPISPNELVPRDDGIHPAGTMYQPQQESPSESPVPAGHTASRIQHESRGSREKSRSTLPICMSSCAVSLPG